MIACPLCGSDTTVNETRATPYGARRRRRCRQVSCGGRVTTIEVPHAGRWTRIDQRLVLVPAAELDKLFAMAASLRAEDDS
jgi:transcriptional regulator NrdR family protein